MTALQFLDLRLSSMHGSSITRFFCRWGLTPSVIFRLPPLLVYTWRNPSCNTTARDLLFVTIMGVDILDHSVDIVIVQYERMKHRQLQSKKISLGWRDSQNYFCLLAIFSLTGVIIGCFKGEHQQIILVVSHTTI